ncbi:MAG: MazG-like family protein [Lacticaseibacillus paracasei]
MNLKDHHQWLIDFYERRHWYQYSPFIRLNFLTEETGELSRAIRAIEIGRDHPGEERPDQSALRENLTEELADVLDQVLIISAKFDINPETLLLYSEHKLQGRFKDELNP